ncbi:unnamed protein product, partial [Musa textilis]
LRLSLKAALASAAVVVTAATMLLHAGPPIQRLHAAVVPRSFASLVVWLTPPYLYFVLNAVILCIAASFRFDKPHADSTELAPSPTPEMIVHLMEYMPPYEEELVEDASSTRFVTATTEDDRGGQEAIVLGQKETVSKAETVGEEQEVGREFVTSSSNFSTEQRPSTESPMEYLAGLEKPLVSIRFGHRKSLKPGPDGKVLRRVARPRQEETLENTWRTIRTARAPPQEIRHVGHTCRSQGCGTTGCGGGDPEVRDVQPPRHRETAGWRRRRGVIVFFDVDNVWSGAGEAAEGAVAGAGGAEPAGGGVHKEVQRGHEATAAAVASAVHGDDQPWES